MRKLSAFLFITLNGYFKGPQGDISWHRHGVEEGQYAAQGAQSGGTLLFGRVTYQMMASHWPTPAAAQAMPAVAEGMNRSEKIVFSRTLSRADWQNTRVVKDMTEEVRRMKHMPGAHMTLLGSGSILTQLAEQGLIDEFQIMLDPVALGAGTPLFQGLRRKLDLKLLSTRAFPSGVVLLTYQPAAPA